MVTVFCAFALACEQAPTSTDILDAPDIRAAATVNHSNDQVPLVDTFLVPCAAGGAGELVDVSGTLHAVAHVTISNSGNFISKLNFNAQGATGTGQTTGDTYRANGGAGGALTIQGDGLPWRDTFVENISLIGPGPNNNLLLRTTVVITINNNGELTAFLEKISVECK
jgi:hypothetical protein